MKISPHPGPLPGERETFRLPAWVVQGFPLVCGSWQPIIAKEFICSANAISYAISAGW